MYKAVFLLVFFVAGSLKLVDSIDSSSSSFGDLTYLNLRYNDLYDILSWNLSNATLEAQCHDSECQNAAKEIVSSLNTSVDPCDNFYDFACQGWQQENPRPDYLAELTALNKLEMATNDLVIEILNEPVNTASDIPALAQAKEYFKQCINVDREKDESGQQQHNQTMQIILDTLEQYGGWPILSGEGEWDSSGFNMLKSIAALRNRFNSINILDIKIYQDDDHVGSNAILLRRPTASSDDESSIAEEPADAQPPETGRPNKLLLKRDFIMNVTREFLRFQGVTNINETRLEQQAFLIVVFQIKLAFIDKRQNFRTLFGYTDNLANTTLDELQTLLDRHAIWFQNQLDLNELLQLVFMDTDIEISKRENVIATNLDYLLGVSMLLPEIKTEVIANYLHYQMVFQMLYLLPSSTFQDYLNMYKHALDGTTQPAPRCQTCAAKVKQRFGSVLAHKFAQKKYSDDFPAFTLDQDFKQVQKVFDNIRHSFRTLIYSSKDIDYFFKRRLSLRLYAIDFCPGNPSWIYQDGNIQRKFDDLILPRSNYLEQTYAINEWAANKKLETLRQPADADLCKWTDFVGSTIAFNQFRKVYIPMGIMKTTFFDLNLPKSIIYGKMGSIVGHEIAHVAAGGGLPNGWTMALDGNKTEMQKCFINYYNSFTFKELGDKNATLDGENTLDENLSDNAGILASYLAFKTDVVSDEPGNTVEGLENYTDDQLFYLGFAQNWCESNTLTNMRGSLNRDVHSPGRFRVLGTLQNSKEFAQAWKCPVGSKMNPGATNEPKTCQVF